MQIDEAIYKRMPKHLQELFIKLHNPGSEEVEAEFAKYGVTKSSPRTASKEHHSGSVTNFQRGSETSQHSDQGTVSRFFYSAKASKKERQGSKHPTVKPVALMRWLVRMVTPPGGTVLDPFAGTGTTGEAAVREGFKCVMVEMDEAYQEDIEGRMAAMVEDG